MFIAHLPAGYLFTRFLQHRFRIVGYAWWGIAGSVFPDVDMLWFYFVDHRQTLHHEYWTHTPVVWLALWVAVGFVYFVTKKRSVLIAGSMFIGNVFLHLLLDTWAGGVAWFRPFVDTSYVFVTVPATRDWWVWSFVTHWSFLVEVAMIIAAVVLFACGRKRA